MAICEKDKIFHSQAINHEAQLIPIVTRVTSFKSSSKWAWLARSGLLDSISSPVPSTLSER